MATVSLASLLLVAVNSSLVGDGSYYLLRAIQTQQVFQLPGRQGINAVREAPLLAGLASGISNTHMLTVLEGVGFVLLPALGWTLALIAARVSKVQFTLVAVACGLCFATMIIFSVSELTLVLPLVVLASVLLTRPSQLSGWRAVQVVLAVALLIFSHESVAPCAVVLVVLALVRARARLGGADFGISIAVAALSSMALAASLWTLAYRPNSNSAYFLSNVEHLRPTSMVQLIVGATCLIGWALAQGLVGNAGRVRWLLHVLAVLFTSFGIGTAIRGGPRTAYASRGICVLVIVVVQVLLLFDWVRLTRSATSNPGIRLSPGVTRGAAGFLVAVVVVPVVGAFNWSIVVGQFRSTITHRIGATPAEELPGRRDATYLWPWTNTTMSALLRSNVTNGVVANSDTINPFPMASTEGQIPPTYRWGG